MKLNMGSKHHCLRLADYNRISEMLREQSSTEYLMHITTDPDAVFSTSNVKQSY